jgi:hypothetical protein
MVEAPARLLAWDEEAFPAGGDMNHIESALHNDQPQGAWLGDEGRQSSGELVLVADNGVHHQNGLDG